MVTYSELSDLELLSLIKDNNQTAFTEIFNRYNKLLYSHAYNKLRNEAESRDLIQEVFVQIWEKRKELQVKSLSGLLFTMLRNKIINLISHQKVIFSYSETISNYMSGSYAGTDHLIREKQLIAIIEDEIAALPPRMREIFELSRKHYLSNREIAEQLNLSEHTVATQIKRSLRILRFKIGITLLIAFLFGH